MPTPAAELTKDAPLTPGAAYEGTIKAYYPYWDTQYRPYLLDAVRLLEPAQFDWKPRPEMLTAQQIVLHIAEAERWWLRHIVDGEDDYVDYVVADEKAGVGWITDYDAPDHNALLFALEDAHRHTQRWFGMAPAALSKIYTRTRADGSKRDFTLHWILDHVQEHEIHHRGQLNLYLRMMGVTPPGI